MRKRNQGVSQGKGFGRGSNAENVERMGRLGGTSPGAGPGGYCVCPNCGAQIEHQQGSPCFYVKCPKCGAEMHRA